MNRNFTRASAVAGIVSLAALAAGPAVAAAPVSQASAQSLQLSVAGNSAVSQLVTATNDGSTEHKSDASTVPTLAALLPGNSLVGAGVAPQEAGANKDGTSYACAGITGTGGGIARVGNSGCNIDGQPLSLDLANLDLGSVALGPSEIKSALTNIPGLDPALDQLISQLNDQAIKPISDAIAGTPLGEVSLGGSLSAIEAICAADSSGARGTANIVDTSGGSADTPISLTLPGGQDVVIANLPANPPPNTHVLVNLDTVTQTLIDGLKQEFTTAIEGALAQAAPGLQAIQTQVVEAIVPQIRDTVLKQLQDNVLDITLNKQVSSDGGKKIDVTAMDLQVLPAAQQFAGSSLVSGQIGHVTCGPNGGPRPAPVAKPNPGPKHGPATHPNIPTAVNSGLAGQPDGSGDTARNLAIGGTSMLLLASGAAATMAYRRFRLNQ